MTDNLTERVKDALALDSKRTPGVFIGSTMPDQVLTHEHADAAIDAMEVKP